MTQDYQILNCKQALELEELNANYEDVVHYKQMFLELNEVHLNKQLEIDNVTCDMKIKEAVSAALVKSAKLYNENFDLVFGLRQTVEDCVDEIAKNVS